MSRLAREALVRGRAVVELGSGVGVAGVAMARCAPEALVLTDRDARALENLRDNVRLNVDADGDGETRVTFDALDAPVRRSTPGEALVVSVRDLDWERAPVEVLRAWNADFVLAADCSYDPTLVPGLVRALGALLRARGADDDADDAPTPLETLDAARAREAHQRPVRRDAVRVGRERRASTRDDGRFDPRARARASAPRRRHARRRVLARARVSVRRRRARPRARRFSRLRVQRDENRVDARARRS